MNTGQTIHLTRQELDTLTKTGKVEVEVGYQISITIEVEI